MWGYGETLASIRRSRDAARLSRFLWEWGLRLANPRFLDMAGMPPADLRALLEKMDQDDARFVLSPASESNATD